MLQERCSPLLISAEEEYLIRTSCLDAFSSAVLFAAYCFAHAHIHHFLKNDVYDIDNEYNECYYLNASLYPIMSKLMFK